jgi:hypothetical protein
VLGANCYGDNLGVLGHIRERVKLCPLWCGLQRNCSVSLYRPENGVGSDIGSLSAAALDSLAQVLGGKRGKTT